MLPCQSSGVKGQIVLNALLGQNGGSGGHTAHHRHLVGLLSRRLRRARVWAADGNGTGLSLGLGDQPRRLQPLQVEVDSGGGLEPHILPDLPHRGGIAVEAGEGNDIVIDLLLLGRERFHGRPSLLVYSQASIA